MSSRPPSSRSLKSLFGKPREGVEGATPSESSATDRGDAARDRGDWKAAAFHYTAALEADPTLRHIWIQLGHAQKEGDAFDEAERAYLSADAITGDDGEPALHLGHLAKLRGDAVEAKRQYLRAVDQKPEHADALAELATIVRRKADVSDEALTKTLQRRAARVPSAADTSAVAAIEGLLSRSDHVIDAETMEKIVSAKALLAQLESQIIAAGAGAGATKGTDDESGLALVFDASDLIAYFRNARLPTGIQRVQIEVISNAIRTRSDVQVCGFSDVGNEWTEVPPALFLDICALAVTNGDRDEIEWVEAMDELAVTLSLAEPLVFQQGAFLVNLGTSWWLQNYFLYVRQAKEQHGIRYVPFVHDFIPIMTPEHCVKELTQDFISWTLGVFQHADFFLVNSEATKSDLLKVAGILGHVVDPDHVAVIPLNADFRRPERRPLPDSALSKWQVRAGRYVLFVSTIESRKNHILAFDAWMEAIARHGANKVPKLVCVGNNGWLNDAVYKRLEQYPLLRERVVMLSHLSDEELALLYRNCLFTLYPSQYEGWGLPVTESLCYSKVPLVSDSSSLPEAAGDFGIYFRSGSLPELVEALDRLMFDDAYRTGLEQRIAERFNPRHWSDIAVQIGDEIATFAEKAEGEPARQIVAPASMGKFHPIQRNYETRIWNGFVSGEMFRAGAGWWWPDAWGCWTKPQGGMLRVGVTPGSGPLRAYMLLHGTPDAECNFIIDVGMGDAGTRGTLLPGEFRWVVIDIPAPGASDLLDFMIEGSAAIDLAPRTGGLDTRVISVGVAGFFLCETTEILTRVMIMEAILLKDHMALAFNREPLGARVSAKGGALPIRKRSADTGVLG